MTDIFFFDSSALVKRYFLEPGTNYVNRLVSSYPTVHFIARITLAEIASAIVRRAPLVNVSVLLAYFDNDARQVFTSVTVDDALIDAAVVLIRVHRLRGADSLQLAAALRIARRLPNLSFVSADDELNGAALGEGLAVENPNWHP